MVNVLNVVSNWRFLPWNVFRDSLLLQFIDVCVSVLFFFESEIKEKRKSKQEKVFFEVCLKGHDDSSP